jgi:hypothetical protein
MPQIAAASAGAAGRTLVVRAEVVAISNVNVAARLPAWQMTR